VGQGLGFPAGDRQVARHVKDGLQQRDYDEVEEVDSNGNVLSITQLDSSGQLLAAVRFDNGSRPGRAVGRDAAAKAARRAAEAASLPTAGTNKTDADSGSGGWAVHWARAEGGVPVRGDETRVNVRIDGRIESVARVRHTLATAPAKPMSQGRAEAIARGYLDGWLSPTGSTYRIDGLDLEWVGCNDAFDPGAAADAASAYRLAWVVNVEPEGPASEYLRLVTMYIDAGDGSLLGGDFVE
jgi:hypothetical protein